MFNFLILAAIVAATGFYAMLGEQNQQRAQQSQAETLAGSMATYREAVRNYFIAHPAQYQPVDIATLKSSNVLPSWSTLYTQPSSSIWANYRETNGTIYIYAASLPPVSIVSEIATLSQNSVMTGIFRSGDTTLYSPVFGNTSIPLPQPSKVTIPNGSPVWIAIS
jgi:type II secretory pathway pseudopilin PulG